jgi:hypothetical protein
MKIYFVSDENEITHCALFRNKKDAQRYIKEQETDEESSLELNIIEFEPNKNGIMDAMRNVLLHSSNDIQDWD